MFWRVAGLATTSPVDVILDRERYTLEELLDEDDLIQECKSLNSRLIAFLKGKEQVQKMMQYVVEPPPEGADDKRSFKYPFISCEVFTCDIDQILNTVVEEEEIMDLLFSFSKAGRPHSNLLAGYFSKVVICLLLRKTPEIMAYLHAHQQILSELVDLVGITSVMEVIMKVAGADDQIQMYHADKLAWLAETSLLDSLLDQLSGQKGSDVHHNAAEVLSAIARTAPSALAMQLSSPHCINKLIEHVLERPRTMTAVIHSLSVCITLLDPQRLRQQQHGHGAMGALRVPGGVADAQDPQQQQQQAAVTEMITGMVARLGDLLVLLDLTGDEHTLNTTYGQLHPPLGIHRLKIVEFVGVLLAANSELVAGELIRLGGIRTCLDLFFKYHFNNFLHHHVERIVNAALDSSNQPLLEHLLGPPAAADVAVGGNSDSNSGSSSSCDLLNCIIAAYDEPNAPDSRPEPRVEAIRGPARSGYMGHLTRIANRITQLAQSTPAVDALVAANPRWAEWAKTVLKKRNSLESVYQWTCGRPATLDDRPGDSDEDEFNRDDRDHDIATISLASTNVVVGYQQGFAHSLLEAEEEEFDTDVEKAEQDMSTLQLRDPDEVASGSAQGTTPVTASDGASASDSTSVNPSAVDSSPSSLMAASDSNSLFTSSEAARTAWIAFQDQQQQQQQLAEDADPTVETESSDTSSTSSLQSSSVYALSPRPPITVGSDGKPVDLFAGGPFPFGPPAVVLAPVSPPLASAPAAADQAPGAADSGSNVSDSAQQHSAVADTAAVDYPAAAAGESSSSSSSGGMAAAEQFVAVDLFANAPPEFRNPPSVEPSVPVSGAAAAPATSPAAATAAPTAEGQSSADSEISGDRSPAATVAAEATASDHEAAKSESGTDETAKATDSGGKSEERGGVGGTGEGVSGAELEKKGGEVRRKGEELPNGMVAIEGNSSAASAAEGSGSS